MKKSSANYVDGFVMIIKPGQLAAYKKMAQGGAKAWKKYGALDYKECLLDDATPEHVKLTFPKLTKAKSGETVVFSYITYKSRAHRDQVNKKVMADPLMNNPTWKDKPMPFDMKRMSFGGFTVLVSA